MMETSETPISKSKRKRLRKSMKNNACGTVDVLDNHAADPQDKDKKNEEEFEVIKTKGFLRNEMRDRGVDEPLPQGRPRARSFFESFFCSSSSSDDDDDDYLSDFFDSDLEKSDEDENWFKWYKNSSFRRQHSRRSGEQYKAEDVDGYVGDQDLDSVLNYIEGTPTKEMKERGRSVGSSTKKKSLKHMQRDSASTGASAKKKGRKNEQDTKKKDCKSEHNSASKASNPKKQNQKSRHSSENVMQTN